MALPESNSSHDPLGSKSGGASSRWDAALVQRFREGDGAAFDAFIREQWPRLVYYVVDRVRALDLAEDIAQEALTRLWERRDTLEPTKSVLSYLYKIARNLIVDELRKVQVRRRWREEQLRGESARPLTALQLIEDREALDALQRALNALPERRREAFMLVHIQNLTVREAAEVMGNAPQTLANQVSAALAELRRALKPYLER